MKASEVAGVVATVCDKMNDGERKALIEILHRRGEIFESVKHLVLGHTIANRAPASESSPPPEPFDFSSIFGSLRNRQR